MDGSVAGLHGRATTPTRQRRASTAAPHALVQRLQEDEGLKGLALAERALEVGRQEKELEELERMWQRPAR
jgi:hypothetical protein